MPKIAGSRRVQSSRPSCILHALRPYNAKIRRKRDSRGSPPATVNRPPVHDAAMIEGPSDTIEEIVARTQEAMAEASAIVLDGFRHRSDAVIVHGRAPCMDCRGREFGGRVLPILATKAELNRRRPPGASCSSVSRALTYADSPIWPCSARGPGRSDR